MDWGNIIYIIAVIIYFIYTASKKKKKNVPNPGDVQTPPSEEDSRDITFEDLLREIREGQKPQQKKEEEETPQPQRESESERTQMKPFKEVRKPELVEEKRFEPYRIPKPKYDPLPDDDEVDLNIDPFERMRKEEARIARLAASIPSQKDIHYQTKKKKRNVYASRLKNKKSIREAIVLNEILKRRHF